MPTIMTHCYIRFFKIAVTKNVVVTLKFNDFKK